MTLRPCWKQAQAEYGFVYALFADVAADEDREQIAWARLRALEALPDPSATLRDELRLALQIWRSFWHYRHSWGAKMKAKMDSSDEHRRPPDDYGAVYRA